MHAIQLLTFVLPLVAALPNAYNAQNKAPKAVEKRHVNRVIAAEYSQFNFEPFQLSELQMDCNRPNTTAPLYSCQLKFNWFDPNSVPENNVTSTTCNSTWSWDGVSNGSSSNNTFNTNYVVCYEGSGTFFEMKFVDFQTTSNITLEIAHCYKDDKDFAAPYDYPLTFAQPSLNLSMVRQNTRAMHFYKSGPVNATIVGISD